MHWLNLMLYFFGGAFVANSLPHLSNGISGRSFQSPFAKPPGKGLSSPVVNVVWGFSNLAAAYLLIYPRGSFDLRNGPDVLALGAGFLITSVLTALTFGRFNAAR